MVKNGGLSKQGDRIQGQKELRLWGLEEWWELGEVRKRKVTYAKEDLQDNGNLVLIKLRLFSPLAMHYSMKIVVKAPEECSTQEWG